MQISTTPEIPPASTALPLCFGFRCAGGPIFLFVFTVGVDVVYVCAEQRKCVSRHLAARRGGFGALVRCRYAYVCHMITRNLL